jgi:hypothetical protein
MAEWLRSGLQIRARRFDSGSGLQSAACLEAVRMRFACELPIRLQNQRLITGSD